MMNLPKIDISALPDLDVLTGIYGSLSGVTPSAQSNDTIIMIMTFIYDVLLP